MRNEKETTEESSELHIVQSMLLEKSDETDLIAASSEGSLQGLENQPAVLLHY